MKQLQLRIKNIENTIDAYLRIISINARERRQDPNKLQQDQMEKYSKYTYTTKLLLLLTDQRKLMATAATLRMQGTTQSYNMLDSEQYK